MKLFYEACIVALAAWGLDMITTFIGFSVGLIENNPFSHIMPLYVFFLSSLAVQIFATWSLGRVSKWAWDRPDLGLIGASLPRIWIAALNVNMVLSVLK